jgi:hypothetical protein
MKPADSNIHVVAGLVAASLCALVTSACAHLTPQQRVGANKILVITTEPALNCQNLGVVTGARDGDGPGGIRAKALVLGGNTVRVDAQGLAMAFYCPDAVEPPPAEEPTP